eukprot:snap_masked-scaffold_51-processed-gene-1.4-mRNA-1 protein AED:0.26 eAED:0.29 QI:0/-1/0/1/-1/1/1/0/507
MAIDYDAVRKDLVELMSNPDWDDGSYAPGFIRLGWHSSGTYNDADKTGGSSGAGMRFEDGVENQDPENKGLSDYFKILQPVYEKYKGQGLTVSDLWILAAYVALEVTDGPKIEFAPGRKDVEKKDAIKPGRLPEAEHGLISWEDGQKDGHLDEEGRIKGWEKLADHIRQTFHRMGFEDREIVALMSGGHVYGRCHPHYSGYAGAWVEQPVKFSNEYAADMIEDEWMYVQHDTKVDGVLVPEETRPIEGKRQYMGSWKPVAAEELLVGSFSPKEYPIGQYKITTGWINVRRSLDKESYVIDQPERDAVFNVICVRQFGQGVRGQLEVGGWVSIVSSDGTEKMLERVGDLELNGGRFRLLEEGRNLFKKASNAPTVVGGDLQGLEEGGVEIGSVLEISEFKVLNEEEGSKVEIWGKLDDDKWVLMVDPTNGGLFEKIKEGYNDEPRKSVKKIQVKNQMMLPADMVLLWDEKFKSVLQEYAEDEELLKKEFGEAYKKLTELGVAVCPVAH